MARFNYGYGRGKVGFRPRETTNYGALPPDIYSAPREIDEIFGDRLHSWFWAESALDVTLNGLKVAAWRNRTGREDAVQATPALQPTWDAYGFGQDCPCIIGTGTQYLLTGVMADVIAQGSRPYIVAVGRADAYDSTARRLFAVGNALGEELTIHSRINSGIGVSARLILNGFTDTISVTVPAGSSRVFEIGVLATTARKFVVSVLAGGLVLHSGLSGNTTAATRFDNDRISIFAQPDGSTPWRGGIAELIVLTEPPTVDELAEARRRLVARRYELS